MTVLDRHGNPPTRDVTVREMLEAMGQRSDHETFRYFQTSYVVDGVPQPGETLRLTFGEVRRAISAAESMSAPTRTPR